MKFISLFAGIGGFDLALTRQGHECVWANEWDKYAAQIYDKNFKRGIQNERQSEGVEIGSEEGRSVEQSNLSTEGFVGGIAGIDQRDITTVKTEEIPEHDLLCGGFPCQSFSIAGKRRGFDDTRGTMFFEVARILRDKKPRYLILENVKGLLSHDHGRTFKVIIATLVELGYDLQWQVLNSKNFGVPQNRERVYIVGHLRGTPQPKVFPVQESPGTIGAEIKRIAHNDKFRRYNQTYDSSGSVESLDTSGGGGHQPCIIDHGKIKTTSDEANCVDSNYYKGPDNHGQRTIVALTDFSSIRRLTPLECERLQGFPDGWTEGVSDTQRYKCLGNAVTVNVVSYIVSKL